MKLTRGVFFFLVIAVLFLPACGKIGKKKTIPGPDDKVHSVSVSPVMERDVPDVIKLDGRFIPHNQVEIKSDFTGRVQALSVNEGQHVAAGEVLLKIEDERLPFVLEQQRAALREAEAQLELDRSRGFASPEEEEGTGTQPEEQPELQDEEAGGIPGEGTPEEQAPEEAEQEGTVAEEEQAEQEAVEGEEQSPMERLAQLRRRAQQARAAAQARLRAQQQQAQTEQTTSAQEDDDVVRNREALDQAKIDRLRTELSLTEKQVEGSTLTTTFEGMVTRVEVSEGSLVKPGDLLLEILSLDPIELSLKIPKEEIAKVNKQMAVKVTVPDLGNRSFPGEISFIGAALEQDQKSVEVRIRLENPEQKIKIGMEGIAEIAVEQASHRALMVPEAAIVRREGKNFLYVVDGQVAQAVEVEIGASMEGMVEIRRGIRTKDQVVSRGVEQLREKDEFIRAGT